MFVEVRGIEGGLGSGRTHVGDEEGAEVALVTAQIPHALDLRMVGVRLGLRTADQRSGNGQWTHHPPL